MSQVICKVKEIKSPVHGDIRGYRLLAVVPNKDGHCYGRQCTSTAPKYIVSWQGDFCDPPDSHVRSDFELELLTDPLKNIDKVIWELD